MVNFTKVLALAILTLISTTIDDIVVLLAFCSDNETGDHHHHVKRRNYLKITFGYLVGFTFVVILSLLGLLLSYLVNPLYIALIGFIPILIGINMWWEAYKEGEYTKFYNYVRCRGRYTTKIAVDGKEEDEAAKENYKDSSAEKNGTVAVFESKDASKKLGSTADSEAMKEALTTTTGDVEAPKEKNDEEKKALEGAEEVAEEAAEEKKIIEEMEEEMSWPAKKLEELLVYLGMDKYMVTVAATTFSVGSDNIAVYVSLFSQSDPETIGITIALFYFMTSLYAFLCIVLISRVDGAGEAIDTVCKPFVPFVLMGIGAYILSESILSEAIQGKV